MKFKFSPKNGGKGHPVCENEMFTQEFAIVFKLPWNYKIFKIHAKCTKVYNSHVKFFANMEEKGLWRKK